MANLIIQSLILINLLVDEMIKFLIKKSTLSNLLV